MNFFIKELSKCTKRLDNPKYIGNAVYSVLDNGLRFKAKFVDTQVSDNYNAIELSIIDTQNSTIDKIQLHFKDVWGVKQIPNNPNLKNGISPHLWRCDNKIDWYAYKPTTEDMDVIAEQIEDYVLIFSNSQEMTMG